MLVMLKIYKKDFLNKNQIYFQNCKFGDDWIFSIKTLLKADKIYYLDDSCYLYRIRKKSLSHHKSVITFDTFLVIKKVEEFLKSENLYVPLQEQFNLYRQNLLAYTRKYIPNYLLPIFDALVIFLFSYKTYKAIKSQNSILENIFSITNSKDKNIKLL